MLGKHKKCVINTDLDGFLCGLLLHHFLDWEVVGFCNSRDTVWIDQDKVKSFKDVVFIDMFVAHEHIQCIDQHIVSCDLKHNALLKANLNKLNPNIMRDRVFLGETYYKKFPFATFHFLVGLLEQQGINIKEHTNLKDTIPKSNIRLIDLMLRADDTLNTTVRAYRENALDWWTWLGDGELTKTFLTYCNLIECGKLPYNIPRTKRRIGGYFRNHYGCDTEDCGYRSAKAFGGVTLNPKSIRYLQDLAKLCGWNIFSLADRYTLYTGDRLVTDCYSYDFADLSLQSTHSNQKVFSYAFISSYGKSNSLSFTGNMRMGIQ